MPKRRIAILGGGMAGLSAAYQLTRTAALREQNEVTIYQLGWRLGGKAASGRDAEGRNLEHGLHVWFGCYENTFQLLQELYAARTPAPGTKLQGWQDAVKPQTYTPVGVLNADGTWSYWPLSWPTNSATPGDGTLLLRWGEIIELIIGWIIKLLAPPPHAVAASPTHPTGFLQAAREHLQAFGSRLVGQTEAELMRLRDLVRAAHAAHAQPQDRMVHEILDIFAATVAGIVEDLVLRDRPLESLDDRDFRAWLIDHGANPDIVANSTVVRVLYDTLFQYADGDVARPSYAAGSGLGVIMRLLGTYKGAMMWDIQAGMGEVIVAPLYEHLVQAGVTFRFFRKVTSIEPADDAPLVQTIRLDRQADVVAGEYRPVISLDGLTCWPAQPLWNQLANGPAMQAAGVNFESHWCAEPAAGQETLVRGTDFDVALLAISLGAYKPLNDTDGSMCAALMARSPRFDAFVRNVGIVPTQAVQLWCDRSTNDLGWTTGKAATVSGPEYLNIWADMTQVLAFEPWPDPPPLSLHYLTGTYKTTLHLQPATATGTPAQASDEIRTQSVAWLNTSSAATWPAAAKAGAFDWSVLRAPSGSVGEARFCAQFWRANIDPTECCTLSAAGTTQYRLHPDESGFSNLILAGEGTRHGFNTTAIEGAVMSGAAASRAICGEPAEIVGYDFLRRTPSQGPGT